MAVIRVPVPKTEIPENPRYKGGGASYREGGSPIARPFIDEMSGRGIPARFVGFQKGRMKDRRPERGTWEKEPVYFRPLPGVSVTAASGDPFPVMILPGGAKVDGLGGGF